MDKTFYLIMNTKFGIELYLSLQCIVMNFLLLTFLFSTKEFRSWQFFPLMMQATVDIVGPGFANIAFEVKLRNKLPALEDEFQSSFEVEVENALIRRPYELQLVQGTGACAVMIFRCLLNDYRDSLLSFFFPFYRQINHMKNTLGKKNTILSFNKP